MAFALDLLKMFELLADLCMTESAFTPDVTKGESTCLLWTIVRRRGMA
jgi:hypothetical protein